MIFLKDLVTLDFGTSLVYQRPVTDLILLRLPITLSLTLCSTLISLLFSFPLGYFAGSTRIDGRPGGPHRVADCDFNALLLGGASIDAAVRRQLHWLPVGGWGERFPQHIQALILPSITQSLMTTALLMRNIRNSVVDITTQDYVDFAKSKGSPTARSETGMCSGIRSFPR
jgi:peptide/nickel transport system permease protein